MAARLEDYKWSSYRAMIALKDDGITERNRTLLYFKNQSVLRYRGFVEDVAKSKGNLDMCNKKKYQFSQTKILAIHLKRKC